MSMINAGADLFKRVRKPVILHILQNAVINGRRRFWEGRSSLDVRRAYD